MGHTFHIPLNFCENCTKEKIEKIYIYFFKKFQKDFEIREMREFNKNINKQISEAIQHNPDIAQAVHLYFSQVSVFSRYCHFLEIESKCPFSYTQSLFIFSPRLTCLHLLLQDLV